MQKIRVGVIFGGRSVEHEVAVISAVQAMAALNSNKYEVVPFYISKEGLWYTGEKLLDIENYKDLNKLKAETTLVRVSASAGEHGALSIASLFRVKQFQFDVALPVMHGAHGEDGCLQGLLELLNVPYAGPGVLAAAVGMDKIMMKSVLKDVGIPIVPHTWFTSYKWQEAREEVLADIEAKLSYPVIVKPANLGSSVGINKAANRTQLEEALDNAATFSQRLLVEKCVTELREINCSVLGGNGKAEASVCEEPITANEFLTYQDKYMQGGKGMSGSRRQIPAEIPEETTKLIQKLAVETFIALDGHGVSRIDFLLDKADNSVYVNEINTIPGSLAFYLWQASGKEYDVLLTDLIRLALNRQRAKENLTFSYDTNLLALNSAGKAGIKK
ncbi:MAG: D-alanine--D-alanine ligase [Clostridia bacterium]|nr:D-alanine--D-alanine ligase [Clostridia bacterium]